VDWREDGKQVESRVREESRLSEPKINLGRYMLPWLQPDLYIPYGILGGPGYGKTLGHQAEVNIKAEMTDPFSVTESAVGVISLGLTVCQGLITYYGNFKAFHEQIDVTDQMAGLESVLKVLRHVLMNASVLSTCETAPSAAAAIDSILKCHEGLNKLG
jgi:hypothetical protein